MNSPRTSISNLAEPEVLEAFGFVAGFSIVVVLAGALPLRLCDECRK